ncbi:hypothetical protein WJX84_005704 [Apatococcus fuscideae]|uniref:Uncharacterized protein n=1 Tax=Apatococcus fuscideae TaxID=2026836 RepID=A0AAW1SRM5_9CHLO
MVSSKTQGQGDEQAADFKSAPFKPLCTGDTQCQLPLLMDSMAWMPNAIQSQAAMASASLLCHSVHREPFAAI